MRLTTVSQAGRRVAAAGGARHSALWGKGGRSIIAMIVAAGSLASFAGVATAANDAGSGGVGGQQLEPGRTLEAKAFPGVASRPTAAWSTGASGATAAWSTLPR